MARYVVMFRPGDDIPDRMKWIDDASGPPTAGDDAATLGVTAGSVLLDQTNQKAYMCLSSTTNNAIWVLIGQVATGVGGQLVSETSTIGTPDYLTNEAETDYLYEDVPA